MKTHAHHDPLTLVMKSDSWRLKACRGYRTSLVRYIESVLGEFGGPKGLHKIHGSYGDWFPPSDGTKGTSKQPRKSTTLDRFFLKFRALSLSASLCAATALIHDAKLVGEMAAAVGNTSTQKEFAGLHASLAAAYNSAWLKNNSSYGSGCQTDLAEPLWIGVREPVCWRAGPKPSRPGSSAAAGSLASARLAAARSS